MINLADKLNASTSSGLLVDCRQVEGGFMAITGTEMNGLKTDQKQVGILVYCTANYPTSGTATYVSGKYYRWTGSAWVEEFQAISTEEINALFT